MYTVMRIYGLSMLFIINTINAESIRLPIKSESVGTVTVESHFSDAGAEHRMKSFGSDFSSTSGHRTKATVNLEKRDGTINYMHKKDSGAFTFDTNFSSEETGPLMKSLGGGFSSTNGYRANAVINFKRGDGKINYMNKYSNGTITLDTNFSNYITGPQLNSFGGGFSSTSGHGVSARVNTIGGGGAINYILVNNRTKFKFSGGLSENNGNRGANIEIQIPLDIK